MLSERTEFAVSKPEIMSQESMKVALKTLGFDETITSLNVMQDEQILSFFLELSSSIRKIMDESTTPHNTRRQCAQCAVYKEQMKKLIRILAKSPFESDLQREMEVSNEDENAINTATNNRKRKRSVEDESKEFNQEQYTQYRKFFKTDYEVDENMLESKEEIEPSQPPVKMIPFQVRYKHLKKHKTDMND